MTAKLTNSLGAVGACEQKVELLLRNGWVPRIIATLAVAIDKTVKTLKAEEQVIFKTEVRFHHKVFAACHCSLVAV